MSICLAHHADTPAQRVSFNADVVVGGVVVVVASKRQFQC